MPEILPPYQIDTPDYVPGMAIMMEPLSAKHRLWMDDYEYYDQLGRDPLQERKIWGITDPKERVEKLKEVLEKYTKQMHRRLILDKAVGRGDENMVRCLVETGMKVHPDIAKALEEEAKKEEGGEEDKGINDLDLPDKDDSSVAPVHKAALTGHVNILKIFLDNGIDVDLRDEFGRTPLLVAAYGDQPEAMEFLLRHGADPTARIDGNDLAKEYLNEFAYADALEVTARIGNAKMVELLLQKPGVKVTPLSITAAAGNNNGYKILRLLLEYAGCLAPGQDELIVAESNAHLRQAAMTAIPIAIPINDLESIKLLLGFKYPEIKNGDIGDSRVPADLHKPFTYGAYSAVVLNRTDKFEFIHSLGIKEHDAMSLDDVPEGQTLHIQHLFDTAAEHGSIDCARMLVDKYGANPHVIRIPPAVSPLYTAVQKDRADMVRYLLEEQHVDIHIGNGRFVAGPTALWIAIELKSFKSIELLLQYGGPVNHIDDEIKNIDGPLDAVLTTHRDATIRFRAESNAKAFIDDARHKYTYPNSHYVRIKLTSDDKSWIEKLQYRRRDEDLRKEGDERELNKIEGIGPQWDQVPEFPTNQERVDELQEDDELIPLFEPAFVAV
ncbi:hypothetical protein HBI56_196490 [Parastagonospora nodorum]|uniref:Clr5 domain-containing protein n=2 Tax=Phaeosphaeria nodorum (strain SN15 / ATCC MYA-4574 / FGSC 10173) TaxID=321614 RepID=A0A7U2I2S3_PHANO|nr:hypothetical protein SNOG_15053 [Parastagonospora nodorum SN15]KAH3906101.1 hypothetical protein HBH56_208440 [Parastagonospora nodorum]EAT77596.1 hypothetical protein SNOG_15053 [Parastagonospora nodorum SN15]KAH3923608.1 hypothetical protein HBH54_207310 [Parastagonospora nodorum]KAH3992439.1 hypothetical protein HBI10_217350 [Parastagonospora nodorum]KAH4010221.1 hypothetical protein HBI13_211050 [Parastagonospora nodorum]